MISLSWEVVPQPGLDADARDALFRVASRVYTGLDRGTFDADLAEKELVIHLRDDAGELRGFSTLRVYRADQEGRPVDVLFSGDTAIEPEAWGTPALPQAWLWAALCHRARNPERPLWWLLLAGGYRTYRYVPVFFERGWPRYDRPLPPALAAFRDRLARDRYGDRYADGVVRLDVAAPLRPELAAPGELRARVDPHVAWFFEANPGHARGDELVCLVEIGADNLTAAGERILRALPPLR